MAKIVTVSDIAEISGKMSKRESIYHRTNHHTGKQQVVSYNRDRMLSRPTSQRQREVREAYRQRQREATQWYNAIKPTDTHSGDPDQWQALMKAFLSQRTYGNRYTFAIKYYNERVREALAL